MNVLFIADNLDRPEQHLIARLHRDGLTVRVLLADDRETPELLAEAGVPVDPVSLRGRIDRTGRRTIRHAVAEHAIDLVHCLRSNRPLANAIPALKGSPAPLVAYRGTLGNLGRWDPGSRLTYLHPRVDRITCVSQAVRDYLLTLRLAPEKLLTLYKGHDPAWYTTAPADLGEFDLPPEAFVVGCAANMRPLKGVDRLIRALDHVTSRRPVFLLLMGEVRDPVIARLLEQSPYREKVCAPGYRTDAPALSGACDLCAMPTLRREGLPRAVIEAMSQGIPALVTRVGGMPELVEDGISGRVVPPDDPAALGAALSALADDPEGCASMGRAAAERIRTVFGVDRYVEHTRALYQQLLAS